MARWTGGEERTPDPSGRDATRAAASRAIPLIMVVLMTNLFAASGCHSQGEEGSGAVRASILAGAWYEGGEEQLRAQVDRFLAAVPAGELAAGEEAAALISPHAGFVYSGRCAAHAYRAVAGRSLRRVILIGPSHSAAFRGLALPGEDWFATPLGRVPVDREACRALEGHPPFRRYPPAHAREHSLEIQLPFLQRVLPPGFQILPLVAGELSREDYARAAEALRPFCDGQTLVVASSDFTHYGADFGYLPFRERVKENLARLDGGAVEEIRQLDLQGFLDYREKTGATICGFRPIGILLQLFQPAGGAPPVSVRQLDYYTSGDVSGDWGHAVSYAALAFVRRVPGSGAGGGEASGAPGKGEGAADRARGEVPGGPAAPTGDAPSANVERAAQGAEVVAPAPAGGTRGGDGGADAGGEGTAPAAPAGDARPGEDERAGGGDGASLPVPAAAGGPAADVPPPAVAPVAPAASVALSEAEKKVLLHLARRTLQWCIAEEKRPPAPEPEELTPTLREPRGAFVTLEQQGRLRGCIGYIRGIGPLWETVRENAVNAATGDPRFPPVRPAELPRIAIEISVLSPLVRVTDPQTIRVGTHGLYIVKGAYSGLLLPQVATEQGWDRTTFLEHLCLKAGLRREDYRQGADLYAFTAQVFGEEEE